MATNKQITDFDELTTVFPGDMLMIAHDVTDTNVTKKISRNNLLSSAVVPSITLDNRVADGGTIYFNGTTTPYLQCDATGNYLQGYGFQNYQFYFSGASLPALQLFNNYAGASGARIDLLHGRGTIASPTATVNGDTLGSIGSYGWGSTPSLLANPTVQIQFLSNGTVTATQIPTDILLQTGDGSASPTERLRVTSAGAVLQATPCFCSYTTNTALAINAPTTLVYEDLVKDVGSNYNTTTGAFTAPTAGYYSINACVKLAAATTWTAKRLFLAIYVDAAETIDGVRWQGFNATSITATAGIHANIYLTAEQVVLIKATQDTGGAINLSGDPKENWMQILRLY